MLIFVACTGGNQETSHVEGQSNLISRDTVLETISYANLFRVAFSDTPYLVYNSPKTFLKKIEIGKLKVPSGKIIACDNVTQFAARPFINQFPKGEFPVELSMATFSRDNNIPAFSRILFNNHPVTEWETALIAGQKPIPIDGDLAYGFSVDAGIALFIDSAANAFYHREHPISYEDLYVKPYEKHPEKSPQYFTYNFNQYNLIAYQSGFGDGSYSSYIGFDGDGNISVLLVDFQVIDWWKN